MWRGRCASRWSAGPGGVDFAALIKQLGAQREVTVWERNARDDTFGFGVVLSDETLGGIEHADPRVYAQIHQHSACWDDIDIHDRGTTSTCGGQGFSAISRKTLLLILQQRCAELGVDLRFRAEAPDVDQLAAEYDVVLAADGANSAIRAPRRGVRSLPRTSAR